jgi:alpha/beta superfamily hydrolase
LICLVDLFVCLFVVCLLLLTMIVQGSGLSEGSYVTLGFREHTDVLAVLEYVRNTNRVTNVGLWGRSMGALFVCCLFVCCFLFVDVCCLLFSLFLFH